MSLTVCLNDPTATYDVQSLYDSDITHNLNEMAREAGIYEALWRPEIIAAVYAKDIIDIVEKGLNKLKACPEHFMKFNSPNGWGTYKNFVPFVQNYLDALIKYPDAKIEVCR